MKTLMLAAVAAAALAAPAYAQQPIDERALVAEINRQVREIYVVPETRPVVTKRLETALAAGRYASEDPRELAERITADLKAASNDGHLYLQYAPEQAAAIGKGIGDEQVSGEFWARMARMNNHGVAELKVLPGNVRYMNYTGFMWMDDGSSKAALDTAMSFLKGGEAVVIDLRHNGGGSPDAVAYLTSHFVEPNKHLIDFEMRNERTTSRAAAGELPAGRFTGKPLYVLTGRMAASAAEEFAAHVANFKLGELVGEPTAGAAYRNGLFPAGQGFVVSISEGRPIHPVTGGNWEGTGVKPTIATAAGAALDVAHARAAERLASVAGPEQARYAWLAASLKARTSPAKLTATPQAYAGRFGERAITVDGEGLAYQRDGGPKTRLLPISGDTFAMEADPAARVRVRMQGGRAASIDILRDDGRTASYPRTGDA
jgi:hypothetical protein